MLKAITEIIRNTPGVKLSEDYAEKVASYLFENGAVILPRKGTKIIVTLKNDDLIGTLNTETESMKVYLAKVEAEQIGREYEFSLLGIGKTPTCVKRVFTFIEV